MSDIHFFHPTGPGAETQVRDGNLNGNEIMSVKAMIAYAAHLQSVSEDEVRRVVECAFGKGDITEIEEDNYEAVIRYLVDISENQEFFKDDLSAGGIHV
jgi:hypothetical protein